LERQGAVGNRKGRHWQETGKRGNLGRRGDKASLTILSLSLLLSSLTHARPAQPWNPACLLVLARTRACAAAPTAIPFLSHFVHFHHSHFLSLLIQLPSRHSQTHSFDTHTSRQSFPPRPPCSAIREKGIDISTSAATLEPARQVKSSPAKSRSFCSSALPACFVS
jgi:hypothetical protein